jgi:ATP-dependent Zn protease
MARTMKRSDKIISAGLATITMAGVTGLLAYKAVESAAAPTQTTTQIVDQASLDAMQAQLAQEQAALDQYRKDLTAIAKALNKKTTVAAPKAPAAPAAAKVKKTTTKAQATTKGS